VIRGVLPSRDVTDHSLHVRFRPVWAYIDGVREFCRFFCFTTFADENVAERVRLVIQELLENAIKYSMEGKVSELALDIENDPSAIIISTVSRPAPGHYATLQEDLADLYKETPEGAYTNAIKRAAELPEGASRLGLARMRYEGKVDLSVTEEGDGWIRVTARGAP
jgi:hypothetical protein